MIQTITATTTAREVKICLISLLNIYSIDETNWNLWEVSCFCRTKWIWQEFPPSGAVFVSRCRFMCGASSQPTSLQSSQLPHVFDHPLQAERIHSERSLSPARRGTSWEIALYSDQGVSIRSLSDSCSQSVFPVWTPLNLIYSRCKTTVKFILIIFPPADTYR